MAERIPRVPVREQDPEVRAHNFEEVCYGYNVEEARLEASRCLNCKNPRCMAACPVGVKIPQFIALVKDGDFAGAAAKIAEDSSLPAICGRVCPQETQCEGSCILGIKSEPVAIGKLERFVADYCRPHAVVEAERLTAFAAARQMSFMVRNEGGFALAAGPSAPLQPEIRAPEEEVTFTFASEGAPDAPQAMPTASAALTWQEEAALSDAGAIRSWIADTPEDAAVALIMREEGFSLADSRSRRAAIPFSHGLLGEGMDPMEAAQALAPLLGGTHRLVLFGAKRLMTQLAP